MLTAQTQELNKLISIATEVKPLYPAKDELVSGLIFIKQGSVLHKIKMEDILYLESDNVYIYVHTSQKKYMVRSTIGQYLDLLNSSNFFRIHRSFAVNIHHVQTIDNRHMMVNNTPLPLGKTFKEELLNRLRIG